MNRVKEKPALQVRRTENIDTIFLDNIKKLEGPYGVFGLENDNLDLMSRLHKAIKDKGALPEDLNNPETDTEVEAVNEYATALYELFCDGAEIAENLMVGDAVQREFNNRMDEDGETMSDYDRMVDAGHSSGDF